GTRAGDLMDTPKGFGFYRPSTTGPARDATEIEEQPAEPEILGDDAVLDLSADEAAVRVSETLAALDAELIGLTSVKRRVREIASLLQVDRARRQFGLTTSKPTLHMSFTGGAGTGKT